MKVVVVIGDVVSSSTIRRRDRFQVHFIDAVQQANRDHFGLATPYTVTLGDEFQAVYTNTKFIFNHLLSIITALLPNRVRISIGVGSLSTALNRSTPTVMDGSAFHAARQGIEFLRKADELMTVQSDRLNVPLEDSVVRLISSISQNWKPTRWKILARFASDTPVKRIADELGITPVAVYKNIKQANLKLIATALRDVAENLTTKLGRTT